MAIVSNATDIRGLLASAENLALLIQLLEKPKALKDAVAELDGIDELLAQKNAILKAKSEAEEIAASNAKLEKKLAVQKEAQEKLKTEQVTQQRDLDKRESAIQEQENANLKAADANKKEADKLAKTITKAEAAEIAANEVVDTNKVLLKQVAELEAELSKYRATLSKLVA